MSEHKEALVRADGVKVYYPIRDRRGEVVKAVDNVSFQLYPGETFGVVGESGSGKSTLGRALIGLEKLSEGSVRFGGRDVHGMNRAETKAFKRKAQIIFQDPSASLNPKKNIEQILAEPFEIHALEKGKARREKMISLLKLVDLEEYFLSRFPHELSGGQKQRIGIARALALEPDLMICDEAVSALDVSVQAQVLNLMKDLQKELGLTYFFISHNLNVVYQISDRVAVMYLGKILEMGSYRQIYQSQLHPYTKALLSAIPDVTGKTNGNRIRLKGEIPSPSNPPAGCRFHTRCPYCQDLCRQREPELRELEQDHLVACHFAQFTE